MYNKLDQSTTNYSSFKHRTNFLLHKPVFCSPYGLDDALPLHFAYILAVTRAAQRSVAVAQPARAASTTASASVFTSSASLVAPKASVAAPAAAAPAFSTPVVAAPAMAFATTATATAAEVKPEAMWNTQSTVSSIHASLSVIASRVPSIAYAETWIPSADGKTFTGSEWYLCADLADGFGAIARENVGRVERDAEMNELSTALKTQEPVVLPTIDKHQVRSKRHKIFFFDICLTTPSFAFKQHNTS